jgi:hypothetical protein
MYVLQTTLLIFCALFTSHSVQSAILLSILTLIFHQGETFSGECALSVMHSYVDGCHAFIFKVITKFWSHRTHNNAYFTDSSVCRLLTSHSLSRVQSCCQLIWHWLFSRGRPQWWVRVHSYVHNFHVFVRETDETWLVLAAGFRGTNSQMV